MYWSAKLQTFTHKHLNIVKKCQFIWIYTDLCTALIKDLLFLIIMDFLFLNCFLGFERKHWILIWLWICRKKESSTLGLSSEV